ncbi:unnamed protein product [Closterium sp. Yama58-4]|nr:unnamed protein product [Closterium sp. Yama58-4]
MGASVLVFLTLSLRRLHYDLFMRILKTTLQRPGQALRRLTLSFTASPSYLLRFSSPLPPFPLFPSTPLPARPRSPSHPIPPCTHCTVPPLPSRCSRRVGMRLSRLRFPPSSLPSPLSPFAPAPPALPLPVQACDFAFNGSLGLVPLYSLHSPPLPSPLLPGRPRSLSSPLPLCALCTVRLRPSRPPLLPICARSSPCVLACDFAFNGSLSLVPLYSLEAMQPNAPFSPAPPLRSLPCPTPRHVRALPPQACDFAFNGSLSLACDFAFNGSLNFVPLYSLEAMQPNAPFSDGVLHSKKAAHVVYGKLKDRCNVVDAWNAADVVYGKLKDRCNVVDAWNRKLPKCPSFTVVLPSSSSDSPTIRIATAAPITNTITYSGACFILSFSQLVLKLGSGPKGMVRLSPADGNLQFPDARRCVVFRTF